jgi:D-3-phosphoglycerate dehydrogenase
MKILANDGIDAIGKQMLEAAGIIVDTQKIPQQDLMTRLQSYDGITVRSATQVRTALIDACPNLKIICRGGVGMDNIDVAYARSKGIQVSNTPASSSTAVAELVMAQLFGCVRFLHRSNRLLLQSDANLFNTLKKEYGGGTELYGKTLGIVGFGRIGQDVCRIATGVGMHVIAYDLTPPAGYPTATAGYATLCNDIDQVLKTADYITLHTPAQADGTPLIGAAQLEIMKNGVGIINTSRGGIIDELQLLKYLDNNKVAFAALDVFENEPTPRAELLNHPKISVTPHIGAATLEAQERIGIELAQIVIDFAQKNKS